MRALDLFLMRLVVLLAGGTGLAMAAGQNRQGVDSATSPLSQKDQEKKHDQAVSQTISEVMKEAADLYNAGYKVAGAYLFRGALMSVIPLLDHRPDLQKAIRQGLADANRLPDIDGRAWTLHYVAVRVHRDVRPGGMPIVTGEGRTVWDRLGGEENVAKIVDDVLTTAVSDPRVNFTRDGRFPMDRERLAQVKKQMVHLASAVGGGPLNYQGKGMKETHKD